MGAIDYTIYKGEITTSNLDGKLLVKNTATFNFTGVSGFTEADIQLASAFGLGTAPDSFLTTSAPEPSSGVLLAIGLATSLGISRRSPQKRMIRN